MSEDYDIRIINLNKVCPVYKVCPVCGIDILEHEAMVRHLKKVHGHTTDMVVELLFNEIQKLKRVFLKMLLETFIEEIDDEVGFDDPYIYELNVHYVGFDLDIDMISVDTEKKVVNIIVKDKEKK